MEDLEAAGEYPIFRRTLSNGVTLIYETQLLDIAYDPLEERRAHELYVRFADGEKRLLGSSVSSIGVSPTRRGCCTTSGFPAAPIRATGRKAAAFGCSTLQRARKRGSGLTG